MSVSIPSSNPVYSLESVLQAQVQGLTQSSPAPSTSTTSQSTPATSSTYNNLDSGDKPTTLPAGPEDGTSTPAATPTPNAANLATSTTASVLTPGGTVSLSPYKGSAAQLTFTNSATGEKSVIGTVSAGLTTNVNGSNVTSGNVTTNDVGVYAAHQNAPTPLPGTADASISVQSGATQGSSTSTGVTSDSKQVSVAALSRGNTDSGGLSSYISQFA